MFLALMIFINKGNIVHQTSLIFQYMYVQQSLGPKFQIQVYIIGSYNKGNTLHHVMCQIFFRYEEIFVIQENKCTQKQK